MDVVKEEMQKVDVIEEDARVDGRWGGGNPLKGAVERRG